MNQSKGFHVAVVGATGAVGQQIIKTLENRKFPISQLTLLSSARSAGTKLDVNGSRIYDSRGKARKF